MMNSGAMYRSMRRIHQPETGTHDRNGHEEVVGQWQSKNVTDEEEDDSWDDDENSTSSAALACREEFSGSREHLRTERVRELLATEQEYVKDLEALLQVAEERQTTIVQLPDMVGNMVQVVELAQQLVQGLEEAHSDTGQEQQLGYLFLHFTGKLSQVYQEYCSHYSVHVLPLLKKFEESEEAKEELAQLAQDIRNMRPHILSVNTVLIKPVQRILRYPLYLDHFLEDTPSSHPDFPLLQEAHMHLNDAAAQINEYTRGLDLVSKYHTEDDQSLQAKMKRVSLHSLAKKSARMSILVSQRLGIMSQSTCTELKEEEAKFDTMHGALVALISHTRSLLEAVRVRHTSELLVCMGLENILHAPYVEAMKQAAMEAYDQAYQAFNIEITQRVLQPTRELAALCETPARLIQKRHLKKLDYDAALGKQTTKHEGNNSDRVKVSEKQEKVKAYEALQALLLAELPLLTLNGQMMVITALHTLAAARLYLQGRVARIYLQLAQAGYFPYSSPKAAQETAQKQVEWLLKLLPQHLQKKYINKDHTGTVTIRKKSTAMKNRRKSLPAEYLKGFSPALHAPIQHTGSTFHTPLHQSEESLGKINQAEELQHVANRPRVSQGNEHILGHGVTVGNSASEVASGVERRELKRSSVLGSDEYRNTSTLLNAFQEVKGRSTHTANEDMETYTALYTFTAEDETQLSLEPGQIVVPLLKDSFEEWWFVKSDNGKQGYVPAAYLRKKERSNTEPAPSQ